jgi:LmbE family N-acetylglucosaminyl deacetylase
MFTNSRITIISAHPDDLEMGMGQFLLSLLEPPRRNLISMCVVTDGGAGGFSEIRRKEQAAAVRLLQKRFPKTFLGLHPESYAFEDTELVPSKELISYLEKVASGSDVVFTHFHDDSHQDHRALGVCARPACRHIRNVIFYQSYSAINFEPTLFFDFTKDEMEAGKLKLILMHKSQVERYSGSNQDVMHDMYALAAYNGFLMKSAKRYAEGFVPWKMALNNGVFTSPPRAAKKSGHSK